MKTIKLMCVCLTMLIILQSCRVYHSKTVSLEEATASTQRVKIKTKENKILKFHKIILEEGQFYGVKIKGEDISKTLLNTEDLEQVRLHNKNLSVILGIAVPIISVVGILVIAIVNWNGPQIGDIQTSNLN
ncbi:hypothetical protein [Psychroserpens sp. NJDZ02]|uniref:hypothetical protein n=1 Tax=Psychroserpens sp. NJDZ02 TaxID=2570561 RepID=UPI0010A8DF46|nr:hypothetical protein [Psychroserpens sp. NJDZ02]QCE40641.1 hypothetical protein E9099_04135 [Psychroserpens sp. NJDZ02]